MSIHNVYCFGDSFSTAGKYDATLQTLLPDRTVIPAGVGGNTTAQMAGRVQADIISHGDGEYAVVLGGINDIVADVPASTITTNLQTIYNALHNAGSKVIAVTIAPFGSSPYWTIERQFVLDSVNSWIFSTAVNVDYKINSYSDLADFGTPNSIKTQYAASDSLHLSTEGWTELGNAIYAGVDWSPQGGVYTPVLYPIQNVAGCTPHSCQWTLGAGGVVTVSGNVAIDPTNTGSLVLGMSLPLWSDFSEYGMCSGIIASSFAPGQVGVIYADTVNNRANIAIVETDVANRTWYFNFSYRIV